MDIIERYPRTIVRAEVALFETAPYTVAARHAAHVALTPVGVVLRIGVGTALQLADEVVHALFTLFAARSSIDGHRRQIVATHVSVQSVPVAIRLPLRCQPSLLQIRCQQAVAVVLQQRLDVQVACPLQRTVQQRYIAEGKLVGIQLLLCVTSHHSGRHQHGYQCSLHILLFYFRQCENE